jgi:putative membrane protein
MVFIDYVTLLLINMVAGYLLLAAYVWRGLDDPLNRRWAAGFAIVGLIALVFGAHMTVTWPLPGAYNSAWGEMSVLYGAIFLGAALAIAEGWSLVSVAVFAFAAGGAAMLLGVRILDRGMTAQPTLSGIGFILSGLAGVMAAPTLLYLRSNRPYRMLAALVLLATAGIWALTAFGAYWTHMEGFAAWSPVRMQTPSGPAA